MSTAPYPEPGSRARTEYRLAEKGLELFPTLVALLEWGDRWTADPEGPAVLIRHQDCGQRVGVELRCDAGHGPLSAHETLATPGAGAKAA